MDKITLGQIALELAFIAGIIASIGVIGGVINKLLQSLKKKNMNPILQEISNMKKEIMTEMTASDTLINSNIDNVRGEISDLRADIKTIDVNQCKDIISNYIQRREDGERIDPVYEERAFEAMDRYTNVLHQNSYIHKRWEEVVESKTK